MNDQKIIYKLEGKTELKLICRRYNISSMGRRYRAPRIIPLDSPIASAGGLNMITDYLYIEGKNSWRLPFSIKLGLFTHEELLRIKKLLNHHGIKYSE